MKKKFVIVLLSLLALSGLTHEIQAQEMTVQAPETVFLGNDFKVEFTVNNSADNFKGPSFKGFRLRSGPNPNRMSSSSIINGKVSSSIQYSYTYILNADREGTFTIDPASCTSNGKKITSKSVTVKVVKPTAAQQQQLQQQQQQQRQRAAIDPFGFFDIDPSDFFGPDPWGQQQQQAPPKFDENNLFLRASASKSNPYQGEQIVVTYKFYTQLTNIGVSKEKLPSNKGFWAEDLTPSNGKAKQYEEVVNGRRYQVVELRREALFPQKSGTLTTDPLELTVQIPVRRGFYSSQIVEHPMHTQSLNINVKPLPAPPDNFSNAVGSFTVKGGLNLEKVNTGEAVSYKLTVSGRGNLMLITPPTPQFPSSFTTFDPQIQDKINRNESGISGSRTYEWVLIPDAGGSYTIPAYNFIYFDPASGKYVTLTVEEQHITVDGNGIAGKANLGATNGDDAADKGSAAGQSNGWTTYLLYILSGMALLFIIIAVVSWVLKKIRSHEVDPVAKRKRNALRIAQRRLKKADTYLSRREPEPFYEEIYHALWGCLSDKYNIPTSQLNRDTVTSCLLEKQVPEEQQQSILQLLNDVDLARFAPGNPETHMQHVYQQALNVISEI